MPCPSHVYFYGVTAMTIYIILLWPLYLLLYGVLWCLLLSFHFDVYFYGVTATSTCMFLLWCLFMLLIWPAFCVIPYIYMALLWGPLQFSDNKRNLHDRENAGERRPHLKVLQVSTNPCKWKLWEQTLNKCGETNTVASADVTLETGRQNCVWRALKLCSDAWWIGSWK